MKSLHRLFVSFLIIGSALTCNESPKIGQTQPTAESETELEPKVKPTMPPLKWEQVVQANILVEEAVQHFNKTKNYEHAIAKIDETLKITPENAHRNYLKGVFHLFYGESMRKALRRKYYQALLPNEEQAQRAAYDSLKKAIMLNSDNYMYRYHYLHVLIRLSIGHQYRYRALMHHRVNRNARWWKQSHPNPTPEQIIATYGGEENIRKALKHLALLIPILEEGIALFPILEALDSKKYHSNWRLKKHAELTPEYLKDFKMIQAKLKTAL